MTNTIQRDSTLRFRVMA